MYEEINKGRENHGKKPFEEDGQEPGKEPETVEKPVSATDPESGVIQKDKHKKVFAYEALCKDCPTRGMCTQNAEYEKTVTRHIRQDYAEMAEETRHTPECRDVDKLSKKARTAIFTAVRAFSMVFADSLCVSFTRPRHGSGTHGSHMPLHCGCSFHFSPKTSRRSRHPASPAFCRCSR